MASKKESAIAMANLERGPELDRLTQDLQNAKTLQAKKKVLNRFIGRTKAERELPAYKSLKEMFPESSMFPRGTSKKTPHPHRGSSVSRKSDSKIMKGYKAGGKV